MKRPVRIVIVVVIVASLGPQVGCATSDPNTTIADLFEVSLRGATYAASTSVVDSSQFGFGRWTEYLRLDCEIGISDPNLVLGISRRGEITQVKNDQGQIVDVIDQGPSERRSMRYIYLTPRYRRQFVPPIKVPKWKKAVRSFLRLPPPKTALPRWSEQLVPSRTILELDTGMFGPDAGKLSRIEGHFYALIAESLENIDVPFKPGKEWVRLTDDLEIRVLEAQNTRSRYNFRIETRRGKNSVMAPLSPGSYLPNRYPVNRLLLGKDGKSTGRHSGPIFGLASVGGSGGGSGIGPIEKIRFVIAVNPSHHKIPFVLEDVPLPSSDTLPTASESARAAAARAEADRAARARLTRDRATATRPEPRAKRRTQLVPYTPTGPMSSTIVRQTWMKLSWEAGPASDSYDVYLGENFKDVNDGVNGTFQCNQAGTSLIAGFRGFPYPDGLVPGRTYYWRVDAVGSKGDTRQKGKVRSFSIAPRTAFDPFPADGAKSVDPNVTLRWAESLKAKLHTVYFGDNLDAVKNAAGSRPQAAGTFAPGTLSPGVTYYWRVDEFDGPDTYKGKVWSFTVGDTAESQKIPD